jgi:hypothetical protein
MTLALVAVVVWALLIVVAWSLARVAALSDRDLDRHRSPASGSGATDGER